MVAIKELLKALILQPLSVGNTRQSGGRRITDANVSSAVLFACLLAIILVMVGVFGPLSTTYNFAKHLMWILAISLILLSLICIVFLTLMIFRNKEDWVDIRSESPDPATKVKTKFLWLFGCGMILQTSLVFAINIECLSDGILVAYHGFSLISSLLKVIYVVWQMGFVTYLQNSVFVSRKMVNYSVAVMIICNLSLWGTIVSTEITHIVYNETKPHTLNNSLDQMCYLNSAIHQFSDKIQPYLIPVRIEYLLLSSLFVFRMWPTFRVAEPLNSDVASSLSYNHERERMTFIGAAVSGLI